MSGESGSYERCGASRCGVWCVVCSAVVIARFYKSRRRA